MVFHLAGKMTNNMDDSTKTQKKRFDAKQTSSRRGAKRGRERERGLQSESYPSRLGRMLVQVSQKLKEDSADDSE